VIDSFEYLNAVLEHYCGNHPYSCPCLVPFQVKELKARLRAKYGAQRGYTPLPASQMEKTVPDLNLGL
jgi:hypothetical protein